MSNDQSNSTPAASTPAPAAAPPAPPAPPAPAAAQPAPRNGARRRALLGVGSVVAIGAIAWGAWWALVLRHHETTDNAYVQGRVVQLTPQVAGTVVSIAADDTDYVKAGQVVVKLDAADAKVALEQAEAQLAEAVRQTRTLFVNNGSLKAQVAAREADLARVQADVARAQEDVSRRQPLVATGAVGKEEFEHAKSQLVAAQAAATAARSGVDAAREQLASNQSLTEGIAVEQHPSVLRAAARVREAALALSRTELAAPVDGFIARRNVQLGQRVQAGAPLMSVVSLGDVWVDANFKEVQLRSLRIGQPAELTADVYGQKVTYKGTVQGLGAGTGAAFALLPAQNATGNWIKVVQRVPVRIALDPKEVQAHPLRVGLSMDVKVDTADTSGRVLAEAAPSGRSAATQTTVIDDGQPFAEQTVQRIIAANLGRPMKAQAAPNTMPSSQASAGTAAPVAALRGQARVATARVARSVQH